MEEGTCQPLHLKDAGLSVWGLTMRITVKRLVDFGLTYGLNRETQSRLYTGQLLSTGLKMGKYFNKGFQKSMVKHYCTVNKWTWNNCQQIWNQQQIWFLFKSRPFVPMINPVWDSSNISLVPLCPVSSLAYLYDFLSSTLFFHLCLSINCLLYLFSGSMIKPGKRWQAKPSTKNDNSVYFQFLLKCYTLTFTKDRLYNCCANVNVTNALKPTVCV